MEVKFGPNSVDEPNLLYKLQHKVKVFNTNDSLQNRGYNLVASSSKYGIVFIGVPDGTLSVYYLNQLIDKDCEPQHMVVKLKEKSTHIAVSCDQELLAVIGTQHLSVYRIVNFQHQDVSPSLSFKTEVDPSNFVSAMLWNPCIPDSLAITFFDGTLIAYQLTTFQTKKVQSKARCICWSPKGKQLVTGNSDGSLCQYKPDLSLVKTIPAPNLFEGSPVEALALYWISTFQFAVVYKNATDNSRPAVAIINASKTGQLACLNYEDVCFSLGNNRPWYYYLHGLAQWNIILASSSNSMEIATFGSADGVNWAQWCQADEARPELPLTDKKLENYPVGLCVDTCALHQLPWGENEVLPHMPMLLVLTQTGLLTIFNIVNLNKQAPQICTPPQKMPLPAIALTSILPGGTHDQPEVSTVQPTITQPKAQTSLVQEIPPQIKPIQTTGSGNLSANAAANSQNFQQQENISGFSKVSANQLPIQKEIKPVVPQSKPVAPQSQPVAPQSQPVIQEKPPTMVQTPNLKQVQENAALKAEQERLNKIKANQELKDMLIKEVNNFQMDLYKFMLKTQETQVKLQRDIESINANFNLNSMDAEQLRKECSLDDLRTAVVQLKLELVRACALVAEARTHADAKDLHQWTETDPLTTKRVASVKKLAYYVQTQLDQAQKSLNFKWNELESKDQQFNKPGRRMIRPRLDDVYQPLVKQQEILSRQQAVLRTLRNTLKECEYAPVFKSTSLLRNTPFRNKDPLSKLTKNILNMSIEPQNKGRETLLTPQKIDALRDMLSNHRIIKIKPVNVELRQHLATMRKNYEKSIEEKTATQVYVEQTSSENELQSLTPEPKWMPPHMNIEDKPVTEVQKPIPAVMPSFTPVISTKPISSFGNVARTLFANETKQEIAKPQVQPVIQVPQQPTKPAPVFGFAPFNSTTASAATKSVLKDLLQNKSQANTVGTKNNTNTFMGQNICSPSAFSSKGAPPEAISTSNIFTAKPISDINNMFNKFQPKTFVPETKQVPLTPKSNETGEPEGNQIIKSIEVKKPEKPTIQPIISSIPSNVPDVLKSHQEDLPKTDNKNTLKATDKLKENIPDGAKGIQTSVFDTKESVVKPLTTKSNLNFFNTNQNVSSNNSSLPSSNSRKTEEAKILNAVQRENESVKPTISKASSIFAAANLSVPTVPSTHAIVVPVAISPVVSKLDPGAVTKSASVSDTTALKSSELESVIKSPTVPDTTPAKSPEPELVMKSPTVTDTTASKSSESVLVMKTPTVSDSIILKSSTSDTVIKPTSIFGTTVTSESKPTIPTEPIMNTQVPISNSVFSEATQSAFSSGQSKPSVFSTPTPALSTSIFGTVTTQPNANVFESNTQTSAFTTPTTTTTSIFDKATKNEASTFKTATSSIFGTTTESSVFGGTVTTSTSTTTAASIFASATTTTQSIFGTTPTTQTSLFGGLAGQTSVFGSNTSTNQSIFGATVTQASVFGTTTSATQSSVFGTPAQTTQTSVFGTPTQTTQSSVFGTPTSTTQPSVFGTPTSTTQPSVFGTPTSTTQPSVFGTPTQTTQSSIFGTPTQTTQSSIFGNANSQVSVFGAPPPTTQSSLFGTPTTNAQSGSIFGGAEANMFASASISTTSASQNTSGSIFGGSASPGSVFGNNKTNVFGGNTTFGQPNTTAASIFGGGTSFTQKPAANSFWAGANASAGTGFGSSTFGQQATTQASSIFGGTTGGSFSSPQPSGQPFGSPQQNTAFGGGENKPSVFSSPQQSGSSFGGSAVFGGKSVFGQPASFSSPPGGGFGSFGGFNKSPTSGFGAPASFGGSPNFGGSAFGGSSPGGVFGGTSPTQNFNQTQSNATFESLATQNTLTFGNLAQQSGQQPQQTPAFNQSPLFTGWRG